MLGGSTRGSCTRSRYAKGDTPIILEEQLSPSHLSSENTEGLADKVGTLGLQSLRKNRSDTAKK